MLVKEIKTIFHQELGDLYTKEEIDSFFYRLIEHYLNLERFVLVVRPELSLTKSEEQPLFEAMARLKKEEPLQYILGETEFMDLTLRVNEHVLIPRPETEELARWIIECQVERSRNLKILDIGTGSGCIAIALAKNISEAEVHAIDISKKTLEVAKKNAKANNVDIHFLQDDILKSTFVNRNSKFDTIVSNPPYVREQEKAEMQNNVKKYEPEGALYVSDEHPLVYYEAIARFCKRHLKQSGQLYLEINQYLAEETISLLKHHGFHGIELKKDIFGNDRMIKATKHE
ncbi:peptide chain release factor N(5)-glutamine methyltransferase [Allomuricauda sp. d1]|uniref:peptide chain release factor N(5)-glutamine methyltransferase n=1 Tax=Allomuricauda sp. d1 TaxID=3136725 RepID=UPI0031D6032B